MSQDGMIPVVAAPRQLDAVVYGEVTSSRAYDILTRPFDAPEVFDIVGSAWRQWRTRLIPECDREAA